MTDDAKVEGTEEAEFPTTLESEEEIEAREQEENRALAGQLSDELESRKEEIAKVLQAELDKPEVQICKACHAPTTQLDANQCPMCGNPFT
jgi:rubrerythrin